MIPAINIINFISTGSNLAGVELNDPLENALALLGPPTEKIGTDKYGFMLFEGGLRYGYFNDVVDELSILFYPEARYSYFVENNLNEQLSIDGKTQLHQFIYLLKTAAVKWRCIDDKNTLSLTIEMNSATFAYFDLHTGYLDKIFIARK